MRGSSRALALFLFAETDVADARRRDPNERIFNFHPKILSLRIVV